MIVYLNIVIKVLPVGGYSYITRFRVVGIIGDIILHYKDDMVIIIPSCFQQLVKSQGIRLMTVIDPCIRSSDYQGILFLQFRIIEFLLVVGKRLLVCRLAIPSLC